MGHHQHLAGQVGHQLVFEEPQDLLGVVGVQVGVYFVQDHYVVALGQTDRHLQGQLADRLLPPRELADVKDEAFVGRSGLIHYPLEIGLLIILEEESGRAMGG